MARMARWCFRRAGPCSSPGWWCWWSWAPPARPLRPPTPTTTACPRPTPARPWPSCSTPTRPGPGTPSRWSWRPGPGTLLAPATRARVDAMLAKVVTRPPCGQGDQPLLGAHPDGQGRQDRLRHRQPQPARPKRLQGDVRALISTAQSFATRTLDIQLGGAAIENGEASGTQGSSEGPGHPVRPGDLVLCVPALGPVRHSAPDQRPDGHRYRHFDHRHDDPRHFHPRVRPHPGRPRRPRRRHRLRPVHRHPPPQQLAAGRQRRRVRRAGHQYCGAGRVCRRDHRVHRPAGHVRPAGCPSSTAWPCPPPWSWC